MEAAEDEWFNCRRSELRAVSGSLFRIRISGPDGESCVFRVDRDVAARVRGMNPLKSASVHHFLLFEVEMYQAMLFEQPKMFNCLICWRTSAT